MESLLDSYPGDQVEKDLYQGMAGVPVLPHGHLWDASFNPPHSGQNSHVRGPLGLRKPYQGHDPDLSVGPQPLS